MDIVQYYSELETNAQIYYLRFWWNFWNRNRLKCLVFTLKKKKLQCKKNDVFRWMIIFILMHRTSMLAHLLNVRGMLLSSSICIMVVLCAQLHIDPIPFHMFFRVVVIGLFSFIKTTKTLALVCMSWHIIALIMFRIVFTHSNVNDTHKPLIYYYKLVR